MKPTILVALVIVGFIVWQLARLPSIEDHRVRAVDLAIQEVSRRLPNGADLGLPAAEQVDAADRRWRVAGIAQTPSGKSIPYQVSLRLNCLEIEAICADVLNVKLGVRAE